MTRRRSLLVSLALACLMLAVHGLVQAASAGPPTDQLRGRVDQILKLVDSPEFKGEGHLRERRAAMRKIADQIFDFAETAKRSLARHWVSRSPSEREEFVALFADLLERTYVLRVESFSGERISYTSEAIDGDVATVKTIIVTKQGTEIPVDYRMLKRGERWLVYDVIIEGVSLVSNYRTQFNKIIQTSSFQELVKRMKTKQEEFLERSKSGQTS